MYEPTRFLSRYQAWQCVLCGHVDDPFDVYRSVRDGGRNRHTRLMIVKVETVAGVEIVTIL